MSLGRHVPPAYSPFRPPPSRKYSHRRPERRRGPGARSPYKLQKKTGRAEASTGHAADDRQIQGNRCGQSKVRVRTYRRSQQRKDGRLSIDWYR